MPPGTVILAGNYGEAGALQILGPADGLRLPVVSGQNADSFFSLPPGTPDNALCVGEFSLDYLHRFWSRVTEIAPLKEAGDPDNEETTKKAAIFLCQQPRGDWARLWPGLRHFD